MTSVTARLRSVSLMKKQMIMELDGFISIHHYPLLQERDDLLGLFTMIKRVKLQFKVYVKEEILGAVHLHHNTNPWLLVEEVRCVVEISLKTNSVDLVLPFILFHLLPFMKMVR